MSDRNFSSLRSAFSNRNYAIYVSGNSVSLIGFWMQRLAVAWLTWEITESEFWVGAVAFADLAPLLIVCPLFGVWADRFDRKKLAVLCQSGMMLQSIGLFLLAYHQMLDAQLLFLFALLEGILHAANQPVRLSIIPSLVAKKDLVAAAAFTAVVFNVARFVGPALAGLVISFYGAEMAILFNALSYGAILFAWLFIEIPKREVKKGKLSILGDIKAGFDYILEIPALLQMFLFQTVIALCLRPLTFMLNAFVGAVYQGGPGVLALFTSAMGVGAILAGLKLSMQGITRGLISLMLASTMITIISLIGFASIQNVWFATLLIFILGYAITSCTVASQTMIQNSIDDHVRGRVMSLWVAAARGGPAFGVLLIGWVADYTGLMWPNLFAALICFGGLLLVYVRRRAMVDYFEGEGGSGSSGV